MANEKILYELLDAWEETYKKGQLTLWVFLALNEGEKYVDQIRTFVVNESNETMKCEEQSLYRLLRKFQHLNVVNYCNKKGNKGPDRKYYYLTPLGHELLQKFFERNIMLFFGKKIKSLIK